MYSFSAEACLTVYRVQYACAHVNIRLSRFFLRVHVLCTSTDMSTELRPKVWNVAVCACVLSRLLRHSHFIYETSFNLVVRCDFFENL